MMYSMVGAVIAMIVRAEPSMALVVFGIGGLLRFRTNVGYAKDTGRVILVTIVGLCCGMGLYVVAIFATLIGWILVYVLERNSVGRLVIQVVDPTRFQAVAAAHRGLLREASCEVLGEQKRVMKGTVAFIYRAERYGITVDENGNSTEGLAELIIGKQRNGPIGTFQLIFNGEYSEFCDMEYRENLPDAH